MLDKNSRKPAIITDPEQDRYNVYHLIGWWDQSLLQAARVMVLGTGATGNEVLKNLALMGVGHIFLADFDTIQRANLARSVLFRERDEGQPKAEIAAKAVKDLNPDVKVQAIFGDVIYELGLGMYRRMDVVIGCVDSRKARLAINRACWKLNKPWVDGGLNGLDGQARVYVPWRGACYECTLFKPDYELMDARSSCQDLAIKASIEGRIPTTPTSASIIGAVQAQEALKIIHKIDIQPGKVFIYEGVSNNVGWYTLSTREGCPSHTWQYDPVEELPEVGQKTTLADFMANIREQAGPRAELELHTHFVTAWEPCQKCGKNEELVMKPKYQLSHEDSLCCGEVRLPVEHYRLTGNETFSTLTLAELGIPALEILRVDVGDGAYRYFELSGDAKSCGF